MLPVGGKTRFAIPSMTSYNETSGAVISSSSADFLLSKVLPLHVTRKLQSRRVLERERDLAIDESRLSSVEW